MFARESFVVGVVANPTTHFGSDDHLITNGGKRFSDKALWKMVTFNAALAAGMQDAIGARVGGVELRAAVGVDAASVGWGSAGAERDSRTRSAMRWSRDRR